MDRVGHMFDRRSGQYSAGPTAATRNIGVQKEQPNRVRYPSSLLVAGARNHLQANCRLLVFRLEIRAQNPRLQSAPRA